MIWSLSLIICEVLFSKFPSVKNWLTLINFSILAPQINAYNTTFKLNCLWFDPWIRLFSLLRFPCCNIGLSMGEVRPRPVFDLGLVLRVRPTWHEPVLGTSSLNLHQNRVCFAKCANSSLARCYCASHIYGEVRLQGLNLEHGPGLLCSDCFYCAGSFDSTIIPLHRGYQLIQTAQVQL